MQPNLLVATQTSTNLLTLQMICSFRRGRAVCCATASGGVVAPRTGPVMSEACRGLDPRTPQRAAFGVCRLPPAEAEENDYTSRGVEDRRLAQTKQSPEKPPRFNHRRDERDGVPEAVHDVSIAVPYGAKVRRGSTAGDVPIACLLAFHTLRRSRSVA